MFLHGAIFKWFIHLGAHGLSKEMSTLPTLFMGHGRLYLIFNHIPHLQLTVVMVWFVLWVILWLSDRLASVYLHFPM